MKIPLVDKYGAGIMHEFARIIGATVRGRFIYIPDSLGAGYITGFSWGNDLRMMVRNYHLNEDIFIERTNELAEGEENVGFLLSGVLPTPLRPKKQLLIEQANVLICMQTVSSVMAMPSNTIFGTVAIVASRQYLSQHFGSVDHPVVKTILESTDNFVFETGVSAEIIKGASDLLQQPVPESLESQYYKLKCDELLCYIFALLLQREAVPASGMHIDDIKAIYAIKLRLQSQINEPPGIASLAKEAGMSQPKLRKLFKQTFGKGIFEFYQSARIQEAARLLKEKHLSVSEVGYQLGFTNLSHFSKVFEEHVGIKPKKYSVG